MIVNIFTLIMLFIAVLSFTLGGYLFYATLKALFHFKKVVPLEAKSSFEETGYLIFLLACVVLSVRMFAWPWFYFMLQSFVSEVPGAMCIFGVTRVLPDTVTFLQIIKPISFFIMGGWLLCYYVDKSIPTSPLARKNLLFLLPICGVLLADSIGDIYYVVHMKPLMSVSCCATFFDTPLRPSAMIPQALFGRDFQQTLFIVFYATNIILIILLFTSLSRKWQSLASLPKNVMLYSQAVIAVVNIPIVIISFFENIGPTLMQLPLHHCIYCFMGKGIVPDAPVILGLFAIGTFAIGWMVILRLICRNGETQLVTERLIRKVNGLSLFCLLAFIIMVTIHLILI
jgi:hypothetical protein